MSPGLAFLGGVLAGGAACAAWGLWWDRRRHRALGRFFSHAAHEINTPITAINITTLNFLSGVFGEMQPDQAKWMDMMREQVGRLNGMVGELRDLIHFMLSRDLVFHTEGAAPAELVEEAVSAVRKGGASNQADISVELPPDLPRVRVDHNRTVRTLTSMVFHARKFRASGGLRFAGEARDGRVVLRLGYAGHFIPADETERSLELLYPARKSGHTLNSVGLGLGVLRAIARHQGGDLDLKVAADGATSLELSLPVSPREKIC